MPGQDERDWEFAETYKLPIVRTVQPPDDFDGKAYLGDGPRDQQRLPRRPPERRRRQGRDHREWLEANDGLGERTITYKLRDWLFSRQRYWGEPFPIVYDDDGPIALPDDDAAGRAARRSATSSRRPPTIPTRCPNRRSRARPTGSRSSWTSHGPEWAGYGRGRQVYLRETNTMPQWAGSCWYYLRYLDPTNEDAMVDPAVERAWAPAAPAPTAHRRPGSSTSTSVASSTRCCTCLYARFWHKVLFDLGYVSTPEPFQRLVNQGYILAPGVHGRARHRTSRPRRSSERDGQYFHDGDSRSRASSGRWARA